MSEHSHIDDILENWAYDPYSLGVRIINGIDERNVLQMRVDMGVLQLEMEGRPDGTHPGGCATYLDYLRGESLKHGDDFALSETQCAEIDREFVQFYHRRICWLRLQNYKRAVSDADHTLALMDFCREHSEDEHWTMSHEQYRPFVMFHRIQAAALSSLEDDGPEIAIQMINGGLNELQESFEGFEEDEQSDDDELVGRLKDLREALRKEYEVGRTLQERLADAVAAEEYELAARLRDELARKST